MGGGGIGQFVAAAARLLARVADVTIFTTSLFESSYRELRAQGDPRLPPEAVEVVFVSEPAPDESAPWTHIMHCYGARVLEALRAQFPGGGPDLIEFPDFLGEAFVPLQAARALDPFFAETTICVRIHTTGEICDVLDGYLKRDRASRALYAMERFSLAHADRVIWQGGDILGAYRRFYGDRALGPATRIRYPYAEPVAPGGEDAGYEPGSPLRILYAGRLERRKGVHNLVRAVTGLRRDDFRLTVLGHDTLTAPLGVSMRRYLELALAEDPRVELREGQSRAELAATIRAHDVVAVPSLWECWPYAALEALHLNRPVLATPVAGESGWLTAGCDAGRLADGVERVLDARGELGPMVREARPLAAARRLCDETEILDGYRALAARRSAAPRRAPGPPKPLPLVSAIVPYYGAAAYVRDAVASLLAQTYGRLEIVIVNDGSFEEPDWVLAEIAAGAPVRVVSQMNQGLGAARNLGISQSLGRYVFPLDADNLAEPSFVARGVEILERRPEVAYVTAWSRYVDEDGSPREGHDLGYEPLGNHAELNAEENVAGDAAAVIRRRVFDAGFRYSEELTSYEDWHLYRELQRAGLGGAVIPERLIRYRVRAESMQARIAVPNRPRLVGEIEARLRENEVRWTSSNA
jgi:glycosyltransferase involved in cell wall biosynthesis